MKNIALALSLAVMVVLLLAACASQAASVPPGERVFYVNAIEIKGSTTKDKLAPPDTNPDTFGKAYEFNAPGVFDKNDQNAWQVSAYQFNPSALTVYQGDRVKLIIFVINGNLHKDRVEGPDGQVVVAETEHNRGRRYEMSFVADKLGIYTLRCEEHKDAMRTLITVVPRPG